MHNTSNEHNQNRPNNHTSVPQIKTLIVSNVAETYHKTYRKSHPTDAQTRIQYDLLEAERGALYTDESKAVVTSIPMDQAYLDDMQEILGYHITNLYPDSPTEQISSDIVKDKTLLSTIVNIVQANPAIHIIPYYATEEFFDLLSVLKQKGLKFTTPETVASKNRFIRNHYNCKVGFRKLWERATDEHSFVNIPDGFIVDDLAEAIEAAWWFAQHKRNFVFKYNRGTSGLGIIYYLYQDLPKEESAFKKLIRSKHQDRIWFEEGFVVEEYIDVDTRIYGGSPSIEFRINGNVKHSYNCLQRLGKNSYFEGILISQEAEKMLPFDLERVVENCFDFGEALTDFGYKGIFDIDLVIDKKGNMYAVESNLRRTGGTHVFETAQHLCGRNFENHVSVISRDNLPVSPRINTYQSFKKAAGHLYFSRQKGEGIIPTITSFLKVGMVGFIAFAQSLDRVYAIEKELIACISDSTHTNTQKTFYGKG